MIPFPRRGEETPPDALRRLLAALALRLRASGAASRYPAGFTLGCDLAADVDVFAPACRRRLERRFVAELLAGLHEPEQVAERQRLARRRAEQGE